MFRAHVFIISRSKLHDTRGCVMQFWPPDDEHMCSKHAGAFNKLTVKQKFCALSWLITEINILRCTVSKTSKLGYMFRPNIRSSSGLRQTKSMVLCVYWDPNIRTSGHVVIKTEHRRATPRLSTECIQFKRNERLYSKLQPTTDPENDEKSSLLPITEQNKGGTTNPYYITKRNYRNWKPSRQIHPD